MQASRTRVQRLFGRFPPLLLHSEVEAAVIQTGPEKPDLAGGLLSLPILHLPVQLQRPRHPWADIRVRNRHRRLLREHHHLELQLVVPLPVVC